MYRLRVLTVVALALLLSLSSTGPASVGAATSVFINEIHYDNSGTDTGEAVEVAGPAGTDLAGWSLVLYNGNGGAAYNAISLSGVIPDQQNGFGVLSFATTGLQNGSPDGLALVDPSSSVVQFLSYEGSFTAADGSAAGMTSTDIGVSEPGDTPVGNSLQLTGSGTMYEDFAWTSPQPNTFDAVNAGQTFADTSTVTPQLLITEIMYDPNSTEDDWEWVEIYNAGSSTIDLTGYVIDDENSIAVNAPNIASGTLAAGESAVLYNADDLTATDFQAAWGMVNLIPVTNWSAMALNNGGDKVSLWENAGDHTGDNVSHLNAIDTVDYDQSGFVDPVGASIFLTDLGADNNVGANWAASVDGASTPLYTAYTSVAAGGNSGTDVGSPGLNTVTPPPAEVCGDPFTPIYDIQGAGLASPIDGSTVSTEGVVVGDFQDNDGDTFDTDLGGFFIQDSAGDGDPATSDGIFVFAPSAMDLQVGDSVRVAGEADEFFDLTQLTNVTTVLLCSSGNTVAPTPAALPVTSLDDLEAYEGMLVTFPQDLFISEFFNFDRFGEIVLTTERQFQPTAIFEPGSPEAAQLAQDNTLGRITLDDGRSNQNPDPARHPNGNVFDLSNRFRGGDTVQNLTGVLSYSFGLYRIQPTAGAGYTSVNPRTAAPDNVGGNLTVAAFNVLNYFLTLDDGTDICGPNQDQECRGADDAIEFGRQRAKIISALSAIEADVYGLIEMENTTGVKPLEDIVGGLNDALGAGTYNFVDTGTIGPDAIKVGIIYKPGTVSPVGDVAVLDDPSFLDPNNLGEAKNRPAVAQSFIDDTTGGIFTVVVNHLKSKGSPCGPGDDDPQQGNCNLTRTLAAQMLADWLATDPTGSGDADVLIIGDLNSYDKEDPIDALQAGADNTVGTSDDYTDLLLQYLGEHAYSYVFDGQLGYLDYGMANQDLLSEVTGTTVWHINTDEPDILDYDTSFKQDAQDALYEDNAYRSSDHDPVIVGLDVCDEIAPTVDVSVTPDTLWPANHKYVTVEASVSVSDNFDPNPTVTLVSVTSNEPDNGEGDGNTIDDIVIVDDDTFKLRAERSGRGDSRIYTITYDVTDACGNSTVASADVTVPHNR